MLLSEIEKIIQEDMNATANEYDSRHGIQTIAEEQAWTHDVFEYANFKTGSICLDIAAGTGALTRLVAKWIGENGHVVACDFSKEALKENKSLLPPELQERVSFLIGDTSDSELLKTATYKSFDFITCRQGVVLFNSPLTVFRNWYEWLNEGGKIVILDALWPRDSWTGPYAPLVDQLPLSCLQTLATIPYLLKQVGFVVEKTAYLNRVNAHLADTNIGADPDISPSSPRFIVVATKK
jgi:ubiquinone/menaquinone biosynthesis C-methylase UbiE